MSRRLIIAIATSKNTNLPEQDQRPQLSEVLASVLKLFTTKLSYFRQLEDVAENPPADKLRKKLDQWFASEERDLADWVVLYYTGHAQIVGNSLYLLTSDYEPNLYTGTAFNLVELASIVGAQRGFLQHRRVRNLLVIVDTCFAGTGTQKLASDFSKILGNTSGGSFYLLGTALPLQEAKAGVFAEALIGAIDELSNRHVMQEHLYLEQIVPAINQRLRVHEVVLTAMTSPLKSPCFFPNPSFVNTGGRAVPANEAQRAISDFDFREHWGPRSRGVEFDNQPGAYFCGREVVLARLRDFLDGEGDNRTRVVTGRPGAGKSAILSRIVSCSRMRRPDDDKTSTFPRIDAAIHARGKSIEDIEEQLGTALSVEPKTKAILRSLSDPGAIKRLVVDALDEALEPAAIAQQLLAPLSGMSSVRLVVGTRAVRLASLGDAEIIDIDRPEYADKTDVARYVEARLLRRDEIGKPTPYAGDEITAGRVAAMVAEKAYPNFLVARLATEDLLARPHPADPASPEEMTFPTKVDGAFDRYLSRFGENEIKVRDIFRPLAYAEGEGLPWDNIWASLASELSQRPYSDSDIQWVLEHAGTFVLESAAQGRSVYRLYHQALADTMRRGLQARNVERIFTRVLRASIPLRRGTDAVSPDWFVASHYVRSHLSSHAAKCGQLQNLVKDPLYLLAADPASLLREMSFRQVLISSDISSVYYGAIHHIRQETSDVAASYLELAARQRSQIDFADDIGALELKRPWSTTWAHWDPQPLSRTLAQGVSPIRALVAHVRNPQEVLAVLGRADGSVELWDVLGGERLRRWQPQNVESVWHVAYVEAQRGALLVACWYTGHMGTLNLETGEEQILRDEGHEEAVATAMCVAERNGEPVCITAHSDLRLCIRKLPSLDPILEKNPATRSLIFGIKVVMHDGEATLLAVGDFLVKDARSGHDEAVHDSTIRMCSMKDLSIIWKGGGDRIVPHDIEVGEIAGRRVAVISPNYSGPPHIWDLERPRLLFGEGPRCNCAWLHSYDKKVLLVEVSQENLSARQLLPNRTNGQLQLSAKEFRSSIPIEGDRFSTIVHIYGRPTLLSAKNDHVRVWDLDAMLDAGHPRGGSGRSLLDIGHVYSLAAAAQRRAFLYVGGHGKVTALDIGTGTIRWQKELEPVGSALIGLSVGPNEEWVAAATSSGSIYLLDAGSGAKVRSINRICAEVQRLAVQEWAGRPLAFVTARHKSAWATRIWDLQTWEEIPTRGAYQLRWGEEDKTLFGLALSDASQELRFAFASKYKKVMVADFAGPIIDKPFDAYEEWNLPLAAGDYVMSLAAGRCGDDVLLAAGTDQGDLVVWDFKTGGVKASRFSTHVGEITQICFGRIDGNDVLISSATDGVLRFWTPSLSPLSRIEIGASITTTTWIDPNRLGVGSSRGVLILQFS